MSITNTIIKCINSALSIPFLFEWQQKICNDYSALADIFGEHLQSTGQRILDVGCSTGACARQLVAMHVNDYIGIDFDQKYIDIASGLSPEGTFVRMDATSINFPEDSFDVVMMVGMLHHNNDENARKCLIEACRVVRPSGFILVAEPIFNQDSILSCMLLCLDRGRHVRSPEGYETIFEGLEILKRTRCDLVHQLACYVLKKK